MTYSLCYTHWWPGWSNFDSNPWYWNLISSTEPRILERRWIGTPFSSLEFFEYFSQISIISSKHWRNEFLSFFVSFNTTSTVSSCDNLSINYLPTYIPNGQYPVVWGKFQLGTACVTSKSLSGSSSVYFMSISSAKYVISLTIIVGYCKRFENFLEILWVTWSCFDCNRLCLPKPIRLLWCC